MFSRSAAMTSLHVPMSAVARHDAKPFSDIIRNFTPNWFTVTMGTGVLALALNQFPLEIPGIHSAAVTLWLADIVIFALFSLFYTTRWAFFFNGARLIFAIPSCRCSSARSPWGSPRSSTVFSLLAPPCSAKRRSPSRTRCGGSTPRCRSPVASPFPISCSPGRSTASRN